MADIDIRRVIVSFLAIVISITVHEFAHAITADKLGDPTPRRHGRITLNPIVMFKAHPFGALLMPLIGAFSGFLVGWAATPVNPSKVRRNITVRTADILITAAGPISNVLMAILSLGLFAGFVAMVSNGMEWARPFLDLSQSLVLANVLLAVFNMMPIPPLDGFGIIRAYTRGGGAAVRFLEQYSFIILIVVVVKGDIIFTPIFAVVFDVMGAVSRAVVGG